MAQSKKKTDAQAEGPNVESDNIEERRAAELAEQAATGGDSLSPQERANAAIAGDLTEAGYVIKKPAPDVMDVAAGLKGLGYAATATPAINTYADVESATAAATAAGKLPTDKVTAPNWYPSDQASKTDTTTESAETKKAS
jgi:hypothetical protein